MNDYINNPGYVLAAIKEYRFDILPHYHGKKGWTIYEWKDFYVVDESLERAVLLAVLKKKGVEL